MKLLQIAYHYPPMGGAGVQRALKFSKYLPQFGIRPVVLAAQEPGYAVDASLLDELPPELRVERILHRPLLSRIQGVLKSARATAGAAVLASPPGKPTATATVAPPSRWRLRLRDAALSAYASSQFPDDKAGWARRAFETACELVRAERVDLILATVPTYSALALAARVSAATGCPWVADYRDLWTDNPDYSGARWRRPIDRWLESRWLATAIGVIAVTPLMQRSLVQRVAGRCPVGLIPNGYDEADFIGRAPDASTPAASGVFRIVHAGTFYGQRSPEPFLRAVASCLQAETHTAGRLKIRFVGAIGGRFAQALDHFDQAWPGVLERTGFVSHAESVAQSRAADLLLLVIGGGAAARGVLTGKLFEYLRAGRPILLLGPEDGDAAELLRAHASFAIAPADDADAIAAALGRLLRGEGLQPRPADARPETFERRALASELAGFLRTCLENVRGRN